MLKEFAVEPALLSTWPRFRYLTENFGFSEGRLISRYPKRWKSMVYDALTGCSEIERKKIEVQLQNLDDKMIARHHEWNAGLDWLMNAEHEHASRPFDGIIALGNPRTHPAVLLEDELAESDPRWRTSREVVVSRDATAMAQSMRPLLRRSRRIIFVDPHFSPGIARSRHALSAFCSEIADREPGIVIETVEFHTKHRPENAMFEADCRARLPGLLPRGMRLRVVLLQERAGGEGLHNRYVFCERGGINLRWGLDQGAPGQTDDLSLLSQEVYQQRWGQYCGANLAFDVVNEIIVIGEAD